MPVILDISENEILRDIQQRAVELGKAEAARRLLQIILEGRFGTLQQRELSRIAGASFEEIERMTAKVASAACVGDVIDASIS